MYGGIKQDTTYQAVKYLIGVPQGTYNIRLLVSSGNPGSTNDANPTVLRVNNQTQKITNTAIFYNNNTNWQTFSNVIVDSDGYMLISQYTDVMLTTSWKSLPPIVLIEITKVS